MRHHGWRPRPVRVVELSGLVGAGLEHGRASSSDVDQGRAAGVCGEVAQQQQVDDVTRTVVDDSRRVVRVRDRVKLLGDLEPHRYPDKRVWVGQAEATQRWRFDCLGVAADSCLVG